MAGAQLVVEAMLQSPNFLFHLEDTANPKWRPYAAASRLSYALWDSMPDDALFAAAARGELDTPAGVEKVARRMLDDPKARQALDEFVAQWLRFDRVLTATKERRAFPNFTPDTAIAMTQEARRFVSDLVWDDGNFTKLFTAPYGYPNGDLARIYGVEPPANDFDRVAFPANSERAGLLGQAHVPDPDRQARRNVAHRARPLRARTVPLPARGRSAARREHQSAARDRKPSR